MSRALLTETNIHPEALKSIETFHSEVVLEVAAAISKNKIVVVGMGQNPIVKKARRILENANMPYTYLTYGNYFSKWKERLAIKLWSGWPTYPQIFIDGKLIGGASDLEKYLQK